MESTHHGYSGGMFVEFYQVVFKNSCIFGGPSYIIFYILQEALPLRMKGTHYLNTPPGFETVFNALKNLLNEKNRSRVSRIYHLF